MTDDDRKIYGVSELTRLIRSTLERAFGELWVEGELSNVRRPSSGHCYYTIKDETSQISAVMFRNDQRSLSFELKDGVKVRALGKVSVYEPRGTYQVIVRRMEEAGVGSLQVAFEKLKKRLEAEGLFDEARKKPLPILPRCIGVVTSPTGAAIRDILNVISRRFPNTHIVLAPAKVQGDGAAEAVTEGIRLLNAHGGIDVVIVGRGGGSLEDLWCFNEEMVARAISVSVVPIISAVGHEIDFTISDFVADMRAPTPSAAAELVVGRKIDFEARIKELGGRLSGALRERLRHCADRLAAARSNRVFSEPGHLASKGLNEIEALRVRMEYALQARARELQQRIDDAGLRLQHHVEGTATACRAEIVRIDGQLRALNPKAVLVRGYSITEDIDGHVLRSIEQVSEGNRVRTHLADGEFDSEVTSVL